MKIGPKYKICRRLGEKVFPKCQTAKFVIAPDRKKKGKHASRGLSEYGQQLLEKQKVKYTYGISEKQFANYVKAIKAVKGSNHSEALFKVLESRLDNIVFRMGLVGTRRFARQAVSHGHITVNGRRVTVPSSQIKVGDKVAIRKESRDNGIFKGLEERLKGYTAPNWVIYDLGKNDGEVKAAPAMGAGETTLHFNTIFEFYSRV